MNLLSVLMSFMIVYMVFTVSLSCGRDVSTKYAAEAPEILGFPPSNMAESPGGDLPPSPGLFDVIHYGALADAKTDSSSAFMEAWKEACAYQGNSIFYIPKGTFLIGAALFTGPCYNYNSPKVVILGNLKAPSNGSNSEEWIHFKSLKWLNLNGGILDAQIQLGADANWAHSSSFNNTTFMDLDSNASPTVSLKFSNISYGNISNITLVNSKGFHVGIYGCDNIHLSSFNITAPWDSPNTDGIHISQSTNINITTSTIGVGDDCVSIGPGSVNVSVSDINCGPGHGISVGSLGKYPKENDVVGIRVSSCTLNGTTNGVRVKTWASEYESNAIGLTFEDIVMVNVSNPIIIDQEYCPSHPCASDKASGVKLSDINIKNITGNYKSQFAVNLVCSSANPCENVKLFNINLNSTQPDNKNIGRFSFKGALTGFQIVDSRF